MIERFMDIKERESHVETWKDVGFTNGHYQVSSHGRYRSVPRVIERSDGVKVRLKGHMMKTSRTPNGQIYMRFSIDRVQRAFPAHVIMQIYFNKPWREYGAAA